MTLFVGPLSVVLLLVWLPLVVAVTCPHCYGNFNSCSYSTDKKCPAVDLVASNAAIVAAGTGALTLVGIIR